MGSLYIVADSVVEWYGEQCGNAWMALWMGGHGFTAAMVGLSYATIRFLSSNALRPRRHSFDYLSHSLPEKVYCCIMLLTSNTVKARSKSLKILSVNIREYGPQPARIPHDGDMGIETSV